MFRAPFASMLAITLLAYSSMHLFGSPPRTDVYDDPLPEGVRVRMGTIRLRHPSAQLTFSADGSTVISCGRQDGLVRHWSLASGRLVREMHLCKTPTEKKELASVELGGRYAAMKMKDTVILRDFEAGAELGRLPLRTDQNTYLIPSADGKFLVVKKLAGPKPTTIELWDVARCKKIQAGKFNFVGTVVFSPDGKRLALKTDQKDLRLWDTATGKELRADEMGGWAICFAPDGKTLAVGDIQGRVELLDAATLKEHSLLESPDVRGHSLSHLHYSADGRFLAGTGWGGIVVWDVTARTVKHHLPDLRVHELAFAPDGKTLAFWGWMLGDEIRLWDATSGKHLHPRPGHAQMVQAVGVSPDGKIVASGALHDPYLRLWDAATGRQLACLKGRDDWIVACAFTPDSKHLISGGDGGSLQVWDVARAKEIHRLVSDGAPTPSAYYGGIFLRPSLDGKRLSAIQINLNTSTARLAVWDLTTGKSLRQRPYKVDVHRQGTSNGGSAWWIESHVAFGPDGQSVTVRSDKQLAIEDVKSGKILALLPEKVGRPVTFSPDGHLVAAAALTPKDDPFERPTMKGIRLIESASGQEVVSIKTGDGYLIALSPDGQWLATIDKEAIHIWNVVTGEEAFRRPWPKGIPVYPYWSPATSLVFLPDGRGVVTGMHDGTILIWDMQARPQRPSKRDTLETMWSALADEARKAHAAIYALVETPAETVSFLADRLKPAADIDHKLLAKRLADLDSDQFAVREAAQRELIQQSDEIEPELRHFLESKPSLEVRQRVEAILAAPRPVPSALRLRTLRAIRVLETIGTTEARQLLRNLAGGVARARETREAKAALERLARQGSG